MSRNILLNLKHEGKNQFHGCGMAYPSKCLNRSKKNFEIMKTFGDTYFGYFVLGLDGKIQDLLMVVPG